MMRLPTVGDVFGGQFRLESQVGEGGFGAVYLARTSGGGQVAIKVVKPDEGTGYSRGTRARFEREVAILGQLRSEYVVRLLGHGEADDGHLFAVFEYIAGRDLTAYLDAVGRLDAKWVEHILRQILHGLDEAHRAGLIHRDLKPDNIRIFETPDDPMSVKLLDFGIARGTDHGHPSLTKTGELVGTPRYMSPEQLRGEPLTPASDIYSLGMVCIELLVGPGGLAGTSLSDQFKRLIASQEAHQPEVLERAGPLRDVMQRMTALEPEDRFPAARAVLAALDRPTTTQPERTPLTAPARVVRPTDVRQEPVSEPVPQRGWGTRQLAIVLALVVAFVGLALAAIVSLRGAEDDVAPETRTLPRGLVVGESMEQPEPANQSERADVESFDVGADLLGMDAEVDAMKAYVAREGAIKSKGCGKSVDPGLREDELEHQLYVPQRYDPEVPLPLIIVARMDRQSAGDLLRSSDFMELADRQGAVVFAPEDPDPVRGYRIWREDDDVDDVRSYARNLRNRLCLDEARTYVVGVGEGERVAMALACEDWITSITVRGSLPTRGNTIFDRCTPRKIPVLWLSPTESPQVPIVGAHPCDGTTEPFVALSEIEEMWAKHYGCHEPPDLEVDEPRRMTCRTWSCDATFRSCEHPGGLGWAGTQAPLGPLQSIACGHEPRAADYPGAQYAWEFFIAAPPLKRR